MLLQKMGSEWLSNLPKATQLGRSEVGIKRRQPDTEARALSSAASQGEEMLNALE